MIIIISPAKKMKEEFCVSYTQLPQFLERTEELRKRISEMSYEECQRLWNTNDSLTRLNYERFSSMDLTKNLSPAILSYEGLQYQHMAPGVLEESSYTWLCEHLRVISGFYGLLRCDDGIVSYRLEMQAKLALNGFNDLYDYWGDTLYESMKGHKILNLASKEYSKAILPYASKNQVVTCEFVERIQGKLKQKGTLAKMARGEMVRFLAERKASSIEEAKLFTGLGFKYQVDLSNDTTYIFVKEDA